MQPNDPSQQRKARAFGSKAQVCVEENTTRQKTLTVAFDIGDLEWSRKISVQLTDQEMPLMAAAVLGYRHHCHLQRADKQLWVQRQGEGLYIKAQSKDAGTLALPVTAGANFQIAALLLSRLQQSTGSDVATVSAALKATCRDVPSAPVRPANA